MYMDEPLLFICVYEYVPDAVIDHESVVLRMCRNIWKAIGWAYCFGNTATCHSAHQMLDGILSVVGLPCHWHLWMPGASSFLRCDGQ